MTEYKYIVGEPESLIEFKGFPKIPRLSRNCTVSEKIDGVNASILIGPDVELYREGGYLVDIQNGFLVGSRSTWITPGRKTDNKGFAAWAYDHKEELLELGPGHHFGEWWGRGIGRGYGVDERYFSLFNTARWSDEKGNRPAICRVVPVLYEGIFDTDIIDNVLMCLGIFGSRVARGFNKPEGVVVFHHASSSLFKKTLYDDESLKGSLGGRNGS